MKKKRLNGAAGAAGKRPAVMPVMDVPGVEVQVPVEPPRNPGRKVSRREVVRLTGLSLQRVQQRMARGESAEEIVEAVLVRKQSEAAALADERAHRSRTGTAAPAPLGHSVRKKAEADAELKTMELRRRKGELIELSQVTLWLHGCLIAAVQTWNGIEDLADDLMKQTDAVKARSMLRREINRGLRELENFGVLTGGGVPLSPDMPPEVEQALVTVWEYSARSNGGAGTAESAKEGGND